MLFKFFRVYLFVWAVGLFAVGVKSQSQPGGIVFKLGTVFIRKKRKVKIRLMKIVSETVEGKNRTVLFMDIFQIIQIEVFKNR